MVLGHFFFFRGALITPAISIVLPHMKTRSNHHHTCKYHTIVRFMVTFPFVNVMFSGISPHMPSLVLV
ncbi:MAG: hypothetical protein JOS17DRAFT_757774 [Linnemannia elongata]|nr:MAG: hypothetical protein JOS17DRAFT_757774 [Linnemannia elongata]